MSKREKLAALLESVGITAGVAAAATVSIGFGLGVLSAGLILFGLAIERKR